MLYFILKKPHKTLEMYKKANELYPEDSEIIRGLVPLYCDQNKYEEARNLLEKALIIHPNNHFLNKLFVKVLYQLEEPIEQIIPYIKAYFKNKPQEEFEVPFILKLLVKLFRPKPEWEATIHKFENSLSKLDEWDQWAKGILRKNETSNEE